MTSQKAGLIDEMHPIVQLIILTAICGMSALIFSGVAIILVMGLFSEVNLVDMMSINEASNINALKVFQISSSIGLFIVSAYIFAWLRKGNPNRYLKMDMSPKPIFILLGIASLFALSPAITVLVEWNESIALPDFLAGLEQWMIEKEKAAEVILEAFMEMPQIQDLMVNLLMIGILPAIGEELLFRGVIQQLFKDITKNVHIAIWATAILFSAMHLQFYGFFPRMALGVLFGYFFYWSGSIWVPIIAHLVFNGLQVLMTYLYQNDFIQTDIDNIGDVPTLVLLSSSIAFGALVYKMYLIKSST